MRILCSALVFAACLAQTSHAAEAPTCKGWAALKRDDRLIVVGTVLENKVGRPEKSKLAECLWGIYDQIADHTTELCAQEGSEYEQALGAALKSAVGFCKAP